MKSSCFKCDGKHITVITPTVVRKLVSPFANNEKIYNNKYYVFDKEVARQINLKTIPINKTCNAHDSLVKRVWDGLWMEGWREAQQ